MNESMTPARRAFLRLAAAAFATAALPIAARAADAPGKMKIGIIGSGRIGSTLGGVWVKAGHQVMFSSLNLEQDKALAASLGAGASAGTTREAAAFGEVVMIAVPYSALPQIGKDLAAELKGRIVIDTCNPIVNRDGEIAAWAREKGAGLATAELLPGTRLVRAFNAIGYSRMAEIAKRADGRTGMPMASDDADAVAKVTGLVRQMGFEPVMIGPLAKGKHLLPGTPLAGEHTPDEIRQIAATLN